MSIQEYPIINEYPIENTSKNTSKNTSAPIQEYPVVQEYPAAQQPIPGIITRPLTPSTLSTLQPREEQETAKFLSSSQKYLKNDLPKDILKSTVNTANFAKSTFDLINPLLNSEDKKLAWNTIKPAFSEESLDAMSNLINVAFLTYGAIKAPQLLGQLKSEIGELGQDAWLMFRKLMNSPTPKTMSIINLADDELMNIYKNSPQEIQSAMGKYNPRVRSILQKETVDTNPFSSKPPVKPIVQEQPVKPITPQSEPQNIVPAQKAMINEPQVTPSFVQQKPIITNVTETTPVAEITQPHTIIAKEMQPDGTTIPIVKMTPKTEPVVEPQVYKENTTKEPISRFNSGDDIINYINQKGSGLGAQLNTTEMKQMVQHLIAQGKDAETVKLWGKNIQRGTVYHSYGGGKDVVLGKVKDPRLLGDSVLVAQIGKDGKLDGRFRTHASAIEDSDIITVLGNKELLALPQPTPVVQQPTTKPETLEQESNIPQVTKLSILKDIPKETNANLAKTVDKLDIFKNNESKNVGKENPSDWYNNELSDIGEPKKQDYIPQDVSTYNKLKEKLVDSMQLVKNLNGSENAYMVEALSHGKVKAQSEDLLNMISDLDKELVGFEKNVSKDSPKYVNTYLQALRALEVNPKHQDVYAAAGMSTKDALEFIKDIEGNAALKDVREFAKKYIKLNRDILDLRLSTGLISKETYNKWISESPNYIPLNRVMDIEKTKAFPSSRGPVKGSGVKALFGSNREIEDIAKNTAINGLDAIKRGERNVVVNSIVDMARENGMYNGMFEDAPKIYRGMRENVPVLDDPVGPDIIPYRKNGVQKFLKCNDPRIAMAINGENFEVVPGWLNAVGKVTHIMASLATKYNPAFSPINLFRDLQEAMIYLSSINGGGIRAAAKVALYTPESMRDIVDYILKKDTPGTRLYKQIRLAGGTTGGIVVHSDTAAKLDIDKMKRLNRSLPLQAGKLFMDTFKNFAMIFEESPRLSVAKALLKSGLSLNEIAYHTKTASINFDKGGTLKATLGALYMFINPGVQGSVKFLRSIRNPKTAGSMILTLLGGIYAIDKYNDAVDPEWRSKVSKFDYTNSLNIIIPSTKGFSYVPVPVGWGIKPFKVIAQTIIDTSLGKNKNPLEATSDIIGSIIEGYNPLGGSDILSAITPTILDTAVDIGRNKSWTGGKISPKKTNVGSIDYNPLSLSRKPAGKFFINITNKLGEHRIEISPAVLNYVFEQMIGGAGKFAFQVADVAKGQKEISKLPFVSRVYRFTPTDEIRENENSENIRELKDANKVQDKEKFYFNQRAEEEHQKMNEKDGNKSLLGIKDKKLLLKVIEIDKQKKMDLTYEDRLISQLGVENGARAKYFSEKIKQLPSNKVKEYIAINTKKGLITKKVLRKLRLK